MNLGSQLVMLTKEYGYTGVKMKDKPSVALLRRTGLVEGA